MSPQEIRLLISQYGDVTLGKLLENMGEPLHEESPCGLCRVNTDIAFLEESSDWPVCLLCPACRGEVQEDDEDSRESGEQLEANR